MRFAHVCALVVGLLAAAVTTSLHASPMLGCPAGEIADCCGNCCPETWVGDGYCDNGAYTWNGIPIWLNCDEFDCDAGDCGDDCTTDCDDDGGGGGDCPAGEIADCCGNCCPETWVGDGYCDNGAYTWNGIPIWLNCDEFDCDAGDCGDDCTTDCDDDGGGGDCPAGEIEDCNGNCCPDYWVGDGYCDDGTYEWNGIPIYLNCDEFDCDGGDCTDCGGGGGDCPAGEIADCCGNCCPETWVGDGYCDNGAYIWNGVPIWLNCDEFDCDAGDCGDDCTTDCDDGGGGDCPAGEIADCNGNCCPETWVGDGYCDDGAYEWNGIPIYLNCDEFDCDGGDCDCDGGGGDCPAGEIKDCNGNCCPETWVGDGYCDDGAYEWNGIPIYLNCDEFDCDGGDCTDCGGGDPTGACCVGDDCMVGTEGECADAGGAYLGDESTCDGDPCSDGATGACCVGNDCGVMEEGECEAIGGSYLGDGVPCEGDTCGGQGCTADINGSGEVNVADLLTVIDQWGCMGDCSADITGDGEVGVDDVLAVLGQWGPCP